MPKKKPMPTLTEQLRTEMKAEIKAGASMYRLAKDAGVRPEVVAGFVRGKKRLRSETVDALCQSLGLILVRAE
jgi:Cro/C1-type HTH DNA-binding domain